MVIKSKALEVNIADYHVDVDIDPKYEVLQQVMSRYYGIMEGLNAFLKELSHPYKNWQFIVKEARGYSLDYFHLLKGSPNGPEAAALFFDIYLAALHATSDSRVRSDAVDNLLLYVQKIIKTAGEDLSGFIPAIDGCFDRIRDLAPEQFTLFVRSYYQIDLIASPLADAAGDDSTDCSAVNRLLIAFYRHTFAYWATEEDPRAWFEKEVSYPGPSNTFEGLFDDISCRRVDLARETLESLVDTGDEGSLELFRDLLALPGYNHFVDVYRDIPEKLLALGEKPGEGRRWKLLFLFHIMSISGLALIHEETLWDINRTLSWLIDQGSLGQSNRLIEKTFSILKDRIRHFPATALNCVLNVGKAVYKTDDSDLIGFFIDSMIDLGFQAPMIEGVGNDWQIKANSAHILNIRTWLELIELNPQWSPKLLSYLAIHLSVCGVFIKDTDLFPRDITQLLNSRIETVYNLAKQLTRLFPVFFNEIGAEGKLRDISTEIDEITHRKDVLVHFLRKQSHVESSNQILDFMEAVFEFWTTKEKTCIQPFVPPYIFQQISAGGEYVDGLQRVMTHIRSRGIAAADDLLHLSEASLDELLEPADGGLPATDLRRARLAIDFYRLLYQKYHLDFSQLDQFLLRLRPEAFPDLGELEDSLKEFHIKKKLSGLIGYLEKLQGLILSPESYEVRENIYKKRHFTVDIPSMYGSYHELKFDALGLSFRIEGLVNVLFESYIAEFDLSLITKATFFRIFDLLQLFGRALKIDGISSVEYDKQLDFLSHSLELRGFSFTQYLDVFKGFSQAVKNIINDYFNNIHEENLNRILARIPLTHILPKYAPSDAPVERERLVHRISEMFFRDQMAGSLGLQQMDLFLSRILNVLFHQSDQLPKEKLQLLLNYDPKRAMTPIENANKYVSRIIYLGAKGYHIAQLKRFGLPVPPGFIITTEVFRSREIVEGYRPAEENFREQLAEHIAYIEKRSGKRLGDPSNALLVSVRSGSTISQPGMMDTFLDVGLNEEITAGIAAATGNEWFAWDNYRRFMQCYGMSFGLTRDDFDAIMADFKKRLGVAYKRSMSGAQMREMAIAYKRRIQDEGIEILEDPFEQINLIIKKVLDSWESPKAKTYRQIMGISDDWGTAVTVQCMVFGNLSRKSGTGVVFTHNPRWSGETLKLWGDFTLGNQGEDVVSGLVKTLPISIMQQEIEMRETDVTLESHFPEIYAELKSWATELIYNRSWSPQEIEFTFEGPSSKDLYLLQARDMAIRERKKVLTFAPEEVNGNRLLGHGVGVSGGAMTGRAVFSLEEIDCWRDKEAGTSLILVRGDTVPDDIREIFAADGLLTARGGMTSHAAVVAHRIGKTCVVGCENMVCNESDRTFIFNRTLIRSGDFISIDGRAGSVYAGRLRVNEA